MQQFFACLIKLNCHIIKASSLVPLQRLQTQQSNMNAKKKKITNS